MAPRMQLLACAAFAGLAAAVPAAQLLDFDALDNAPAVQSGPEVLPTAAAATVALETSISISGVVTAQATVAPTTIPHQKRATTTPYTPYYPALATGYTTDPALAATSTTTANQPCVTQPEAGTYCGFLNPLDACAPQPDGYGPVPSPDTASAFLDFDTLHALAQAAPTKVASTDGATYQQVFKDLDASISGGSYLGYATLQSYDVAGCAAKCDSTDLCTAFNIFAERDPSLRPSYSNDTYDPGYATVWGKECPNPPSMTTFKCTLWGSQITASMATNTGETLAEFQIVITASNGYDKTNSTTPPDVTAPVTETSTVPVTTISSTSEPVVTPTKPTTSSAVPITTSSVVSSASSPSSVAPAPYTSTTSQGPTAPAPYTTSSVKTTVTPPGYVTTSKTTLTTVTPKPYTTTTTTTKAAPPAYTPPAYNPPTYNPPSGGFNWPWSPKPAPAPAPAPPKYEAPAPAPPKYNPAPAPPKYNPAPAPAPKPYTPAPKHPWSKPQTCKGKAISAPKYSMGGQFFPGAYNPQHCSDYALAQNAANAKANSKSKCQMFNAYYLHKNGKPYGTQCNLYSTHLEPSWGVSVSQRSPKGDLYECKQSWTYTLL